MKNENSEKNQIWSLIEKLFPIHRTLINDGFDKSLEIGPTIRVYEGDLECCKNIDKTKITIVY